MPDAVTARRPRSDATRNREAVLAAADRLFGTTEDVSVEAVARAAGVGKATVFRAFGDRAGLLRALFDQRGQALLVGVLDGPPPLGPGADPGARIRAVLDAVLTYKLANRSLSLALDRGSGSSPFVGAHYEPLHATLVTQLRLLADPAPDFTAHVLLGAVRSDLIEHLLSARRWTRRRIRTELNAFVTALLEPSSPTTEQR